MWFSFFGLPAAQLILPYETQSPTLRQVVAYNNEEDILTEVYRILNEKGTKRFGIGQSLYYQLPLFCNPSTILPDWCWHMIEDYQLVKTYNIPVFKTLDSISVWHLDCFNKIGDELNKIEIHKAKKDGNS